jgi:hypothetical protein
MPTSLYSQHLLIEITPLMKSIPSSKTKGAMIELICIEELLSKGSIKVIKRSN